MKTNAPQFLEVTEAKYVSGYNLLVNFDDGTRRVVDFGPFLKQAKNPMITKYRSIKEFKSFHIRNGDLMWGDFEMIFPIMDLYEGNILKGRATTPSHFVLSDAGSAAKTVLEKKVSYKKTKREPRVRTPEN